MEEKTILIVEDERAIADIIAFNLQRESYRTRIAYDGVDGLRCALEDNPDLILLDVMLPLMDGFEVCRRVRAQKQTPIVMLTAREQEQDKVLGLELGADDYITKPFSMRELMARVKANLRRSAIGEAAGSMAAASHAQEDALSICRDTGMVYKRGKALDLTAREYDVLCFLSAQPGRVVTREELMGEVWGYEYYGDLRAVDVAIRRLREKVEDDPANPCYVMTKRGKGYYFVAESNM